jgi:cytoskeleton protein RodZ
MKQNTSCGIVEPVAFMNEISPQNTDNVSTDTEDSPSGPLAGQRLAIARREHDISIAEIAKELHLDEAKVQALEENLFDLLGAPVFAKGHLRKYAELVGVPTDDVLADYYKLNRSTGAPPVVGPKRLKPPVDISLGPWIAGAVLIALLAGAIYWWLNREPSAEITATPGTLEPFVSDRADEELEPAVKSSSADVPAGEAGPAEVDAAPAAAEIKARVEPAYDQGPVAAAGENQLQIAMTFSGDCWTEITDANGERLFFGLGQAGQVVTRNGIPPLRALFGNANNVSVTVDGVEFPIASRAGRGNTARVTIDDH